MESCISLLKSDRLSASSSNYAVIVYRLALFQCSMQLRADYGKTGWNLPYEFGNDLFCSAVSVINQYVQLLNDEAEGEDSIVKWHSLMQLIADYVYSNTITDKFDREVMEIYLKELCTDDVFSCTNSAAHTLGNILYSLRLA
ncbi:hypothetical protein O3M35_004031 [Rhynocoris fuscipes]|uniref:Dynein heavy chain AAA lid domain-containing protein n=1 Tax=Rhynocoris fuscipes TaxID=488301 RepID=A0AAW1CMV7_9HEMI